MAQTAPSSISQPVNTSIRTGRKSALLRRQCLPRLHQQVEVVWRAVLQLQAAREAPAALLVALAVLEVLEAPEAVEAAQVAVAVAVRAVPPRSQSFPPSVFLLQSVLSRMSAFDPSWFSKNCAGIWFVEYHFDCFLALNFHHFPFQYAYKVFRP